MFRRSALRAFSSSARAPSRLRAAANHFPNGATFTVQRVRFKRPPFFTWRRFSNALFYLIPAYTIWQYLFPIVVELDVDDQAEVVGGDGIVDVERNNDPDREDPEGDEEFEGDEDALFIPFSWPKQQPRTFYKGSDPEWQEFIKLSKDPQRHKDIQRRLVSNIRSELSQHPQASRILGQIDHKKGKFWLEISFPEGPPTEYAVTGLEIGDEYIAWVSKPMSQKDYQKLQRTMVPTAAFWSTWAAAKYLLNVQLNKVKQSLGLAPAANPQIESVQKRVQPKQDHNGKGSANEKSGAQSNPEGGPGTAKQRTSAPATDQTPKTGSGGSASPDQKKVGLPKLPSLSPRGNDNPITLAIFMHSMAHQMSKPYRVELPRGTVGVSGLVEVVGTKGKATLDVTAAYDPKENEFVGSYWRPRRIQPRSQSPRGGP